MMGKHDGGLNMHQVLFHLAVLTVTRLQAEQPLKAVYAFEVPSSTEPAFDQFAFFQPNAFVDITATLATKLEAVARYGSQARPFPHPRSPKARRALARWRASAAGMEVAQGFGLVWNIRW